mgnify:CR=1 FL=1|jgi:hypothetical protein
MELGPKIRLAHANIPSLISAATPAGSCSAIQPTRHPGRRNRLDRPDKVMTGTEVETAARGTNGSSHV